MASLNNHIGQKTCDSRFDDVCLAPVNVRALVLESFNKRELGLFVKNAMVLIRELKSRSNRRHEKQISENMWATAIKMLGQTEFSWQ